MNFKAVWFLSAAFAAALIAGCGSSGEGNDESGYPDINIVVDYGNTADHNAHPDNVVVDDNGNPVDNSTGHDDNNPEDNTVHIDNGGHEDTNVPVDEGGGVDTTINKNCTMPSCSFETTAGGLKDNCDGTFTDPSTGLMWQAMGEDQTEKNKMLFQCNTLYLGCNGGKLYDDWRVPTIDEVRTLVRGCPATEDGGSCTVTAACWQESCVNDACSGCASNAGPIDYETGGEHYGRYIDPALQTKGYGSSYSVVISQTQTGKTASDSRDRFFYIQNYNAKLATVRPLEPLPEGAVFCVRGSL